MTLRGCTVLPELEILSALDFDTAVPCICQKFCDEADHAADWWVTLSCGCRYPFCKKALQISKIRLKVRSLTCRLCSAQDITIRSVKRI